jgi:hypothetical protein
VSQFVISALRAALVVMGLGALGLQVLIIVLIVMNAAEADPGDPGVLYAILGIATLACLELGLVAVWVLLGMVRRDAIFDERAFRWVSVITTAGLAATLPVAVFCAHFGELDDAPGMILIGGGVVLAGVSFALLMTVMRGLLRKATVLRRELDEVV